MQQIITAASADIFNARPPVADGPADDDPGAAPGCGGAVAAPMVVVLGMHRSGTSLCANVLHALGVDMADSPGAGPGNARGHWERARINDLNDSVFAAFGRAWNDGAHALALPDGWVEDPRVQSVRGALVQFLAPRLRPSRTFGFKDPRTARLLTLWRQVFASLAVAPRFVFCVRDPAQVARSVAARDRMAREQAEYRWLIYNTDAVAGVGGEPVCVVPYEDWFCRPEQTVARLAAFVGAPPPDPRLAAAVVDPALRHDEPVAPARPLARRLHRQFVAAAGAERFDPALVALCGMVGDFQAQVQPLLLDVEILRASVAEQNRVIADLDGLVRQLRHAA